MAFLSGLVGVVQINYEVPSGVATGTQAVVVTVGGVFERAGAPDGNERAECGNS